VDGRSGDLPVLAVDAHTTDAQSRHPDARSLRLHLWQRNSFVVIFRLRDVIRNGRFQFVIGVVRNTIDTKNAPSRQSLTQAAAAATARRPTAGSSHRGRQCVHDSP
jgi:hypothetical protein